MAGVPAFCPTCEMVFESNVNVGNGSHITFQNCGTNCPRGHDAEILDATYDFVADEIKVISASPVNRALVEQLEAIRRKVRKQSTITDDVIDALEAVQPELAKTAKLLKNKKFGAAILAGLIYLSASQCEPKGGLTIDLSSHTQVTQFVAAPTRIEQTALYYPHKPKQKEAGDHAKAAADSPEPK